MSLSRFGRIFRMMFEVFSRRGSSTASGLPSSSVGSSASSTSSSDSLKPVAVLKTSLAGIELIKHYEGIKLQAYPDPATGGDPWTVGYGETGPHVVKGLKITQAEAERMLADRLTREFEPGVRAALRVPVSQWQFDAMVSLAYNIGVKAFSQSTLARLVNAGQASEAAAQFPRWDKAAGNSMRGLRRRRAAEQALFLGFGIAQALQIGDKTA